MLRREPLCLHPDHFIDLVPLRYGRRYGAAGARPVPVYLPPAGIACLERLARVLSHTQPFWDGALDLCEYEPGAAFAAGDITIQPHEVVHGIRSFGQLVEATGRRLAYSSDTIDCAELRALAGEAHVLLAEATLAGGAPTHHEPVTHLSAEQAGRIAAEAENEALVLTHFWHTADRTQAEAEARTMYGGRVLSAHPGLRLEI